MVYSQEQVAMLMNYLGTISVVGVVSCVLAVIAMWRIFTKAGQAGWKAIIPVYNMYVAYKLAWKSQMFWCSLVLTFVGCLCYIVGGGIAGAIGMIAMLAAGIVTIMYNYKLARAFGKGIGYTLGLLFLNPIFMLLLGFGGAQYIGADQ